MQSDVWGIMRCAVFAVFLNSLPGFGFAETIARDPRELYNEARSLVDAGEFDAAAESAGQILDVLRDMPGASTSDLAAVQRLRLYATLQSAELAGLGTCVPTPERLLPLVEDAHEAAIRSGDPSLLASISHLAANAALLSGRYRDASRLSEEAAEHYRSASPCAAAASRRVGANALLLERDLEGARAALKDAASLMSEQSCPAVAHRDLAILNARASLLVGRYHAAEDVLRDLLPNAKDDLGAILYHLAEVNVMQGRYSEAELINDQARRALAAVYPNHPVLAQIAHRGAIIRQELGDWSEARRLYGRAVEALSCQLGARHPSTMAIRREEARLLSRQGKSTDAVVAVEAVVRDATFASLPLQESALNRAALGLILHEAGEDRRATTELRGALEIMSDIPGTEADQTPAFLALAEIALTESRLESARTYAQSAIEILETLDSQSVQRLGRARRVLAEIELVDGNTALARELVGANVDGIREQIATERRLATYTTELRPVEIRLQLEQAMALGWETDDEDTALEEIFRLMQVLHQAMGARNGGFGEAGGAEERALLAQIEGLERLNRGATGNATELQIALDAAREALSGLRGRDSFPVSALPLRRLSDVQSALSDEQVVWMHASFAASSYVFLVTSNGAAMARLGMTATELADLKSTLRAELDMSQRRIPKAPDFPVEVAYTLYCTHFGVFSRHADCQADLRGEAMLSPGSEVFVMPDQALQEIALSALLLRPLGPAPTTYDLRGAQWFIREHPHATILALDTLFGANRTSSPATRRFFGVAPFGPRGPGRSCPADSFPALASRGEQMLGALDPKLATSQGLLPGTVELVEATAEVFGAQNDRDVFLCGAATEAQLMSADLSTVDHLLLATHAEVGQLPPNLPEPGLFLAPPAMREWSANNDGYLRASEIAAMQINARLVVLSACSTGSSSGLPGAPGLSGVAQAFFRAGAKALAVSHWDVTSVSASTLFARFFELRHAAPEESLSRQLQAAMLEFLEPDKPAPYAHPFVWAPFFIVNGA